MSNLTRSQNTTPVYVDQPGGMTNAQHVAIATFYSPATSYAPTQSNNADPLAKMIFLTLLGGFFFAVSLWFFSRPNAEHQQALVENAQLRAENNAIVGCVEGVKRGQQ